MKDSKEKEHRISNLKDLIDNVKEDKPSEDPQEDKELINYLEDSSEFDKLDIDDEYIYHPDNNKADVVNLEDAPIDKDFLINTPKEEKLDDLVEELEEPEDIISEMSENFEYIINAKIGRTPILGIFSAVLGVVLLIASIFIFQSASDRVIDNVVAGETNIISVLALGFGIIFLAYGIYKVFNVRNPLIGITNSINSIDAQEKVKKEEAKEKENKNVIPKSNIPLDKDSYKIGEFNIKDIKTKFKKSSDSNKKPLQPITENIDDIPPAKEKEESKKGLTREEIEDIEYRQAKLDNESIDDIFAKVDDID